MKNTAMAALLLASTCAVQAGGPASATLEVRFVIRAACSIQADAAAGAPRVACSQGTGYQLRRQDTPDARTAGQAGGAWQVVF